MGLDFATTYSRRLTAVCGRMVLEYVPQQLLTHLPPHAILPSLPNTWIIDMKQNTPSNLG